MADTPLILSIDQGTTSSRALVFDASGRIVALAQQEFPQHYPKPGWVEHDPEDIWKTTLETARKAMQDAEHASSGTITCIGIANQRETTFTWDLESGESLGRAIVWQDRRTAAHCNALKDKGLEDLINDRTGLTLDPYFSGTKLSWVLNNSERAAELASKGRLAFGTADSFLLYRLTGGRVHATDETNASRTLLYNIRYGRWDNEIIQHLDVGDATLPDVQASASNFGETDPALFGRAIPILGMAGDQQAAAFGQACWKPGMVKSTYGTGCFLLANTGSELLLSKNRLLSTIACRIGSDAEYAIEGSIFIAGAVSQWLRDELGIIEKASDTETIAESVSSTDGVYVVPAFTGMGAPYWDADARGAVFGLTRSTGKAELVRAALESVAYQTADLNKALASDGLKTSRIRVDGGMVRNSWFVQFLADILGVPVDRPQIIESTARGVAFLAGLEAGIFSNIDQLEGLWSAEHTFLPTMSDPYRDSLLQGWDNAVKSTLFHAQLTATYK